VQNVLISEDEKFRSSNSTNIKDFGSKSRSVKSKIFVKKNFHKISKNNPQRGNSDNIAKFKNLPPAKHSVTDTNLNLSNKESFIKENSNFISDCNSIIQERDVFFPEERNKNYQTPQNIQEYKKPDFNDLNNLEISLNNEYNLEHQLGQLEQLDQLEESILQNKKFRPRTHSVDLLEIQPNFKLSKCSTKKKQTYNVLNKKMSNKTLQNSTIKKRVAKKMTPLNSEKNPISRNSAKQTIGSGDNDTNLSSNRRERIDIYRNTKKLQQFESLIKKNPNSKILSSIKKNPKAAEFFYQPEKSGGTMKIQPQGMKKMSLGKYEYLFSDVTCNNKEMKKINNISISEIMPNNDLSKSNNLDLKELKDVINFNNNDKKNSQVINNKSFYSNLFV
jgi:hypothetical protein